MTVPSPLASRILQLVDVVYNSVFKLLIGKLHLFFFAILPVMVSCTR
jgi:hypothetical protein